MPIVKNKGKTVFGVRIGLRLSAFRSPIIMNLSHTAKPSTVVV